MDCFICGEKKPPLIKSSRIAGLRDASRLREDGLFEKLTEAAESFMCHKNCIQTYCSKDHIQRLLRKRKAAEVTEKYEAKRLRGDVHKTESSFRFRDHCFFCGEDCNVEKDKKNPNRWRQAYLCRTGTEAWRKTSKHEILKRCKERGDEWGKEVEFRVNAVLSDLHAEDGRYHKDCYSKFYSNEAAKTSSSETDNALEQLISRMIANKGRMWNSVELHNVYLELGGRTFSRRSLLKIVSEKLSPDLLILSSPGVASIIVFRSKASKDLRILDDAEDDCTLQAISYLAANIKAECPTLDRNSYKTRLSKKEILNECSPTLLALLSAISENLDSTLPSAMIGHIITNAVTHQTTSLQLGISVLLSRHRKFIDELHAYRVTSNYDELRRFKISAATAMASAQKSFSQFDSETGMVQVVADNFDVQISSQNGQKSTHGLAMIMTQANHESSSQLTDVTEIPSIKRLKLHEIKAENLTLDEVKVQRYNGERKPRMPREDSMKSVSSLVFLAKQKISLNRMAKEDFTFLYRITSDEACPEYGGFNTQQARENNQKPLPKTALMYTPFLDMPPAEPDTMKTAMMEAKRLSSMTGQKWTVFTNDQQLYQVAVHVTWVDKELFSDFIPRLGGMHMLMSFMGCIGTLMEGSGLEQILETTFAGVPKLLTGKKYPQNVRALRLVVEELLRPLISRPDIHTMADLTKLLNKFSASSKTTKLWVHCLIDAVFITMAFVRAEREADWPLHLYAVEKMMPYFFAAGHFNYARYGLYYLRSMQRIPPDLSKMFMNGDHVMRHEAGLWNGIWSDLFIETTYMRYGHGPSGIIGSTLNESTLAIWAYSHSTLTQIIQDLQEMKDGKEHNSTVMFHKEEKKTRLKEDFVDRQKIREALSTCLDVFDVNNHPENGIINIYSGLVIDEPSLNVYDAIEIGAKQCREFESCWPSGFHGKLKRFIKTMSSVIKKTSKDIPGKSEIDTEFIYARVLGIMASTRDSISLETLFSYELAPHPTALFDINRDMRTTSKSVLKQKVQVMCGTRGIDPPSVVILDACAVLWIVPWPAQPAKVADFINVAVVTLLRYAETCKVLHIVFDRYYNLSVKSCCRTARQRGFSRVYTLTENTPLPKQALILNVTSNKKQIIQMIVDRMCAMVPDAGKQIIITGQDLQPFLMGDGPINTAVHHEEADVLMAFHMIREAKNGYKSIKVVSDDTDVLLILAHHLYFRTNSLPDDLFLMMQSCTSTSSIINVGEVVNRHNSIMPNLLCAHALTGCDTVSSFSGIGKLSVLKKLSSFSGCLRLGDLTAEKEDIIRSCLQFISILYGHVQETDLTIMRSEIFRRKIKGKHIISPKLSTLPPTIKSFEAHCLRAHYQVSLWKAAGLPTTPDISPLNCGWEQCGSTLIPQHALQEQLPAPNEVLNLISCMCKTGCSTAMCTCRKSALTCTQFCKCKGTFLCKNPLTVRDATRDTEEDDAESA